MVDIEIVMLNASGSEAAAKAQRQIPSLCTSTSRCLELEPPLLDLDLRALEHAPLPNVPPPTWLTGEADAWGCAYVLEGATLGGQVVTRHLRRTGFPDNTLHFYRSYGEQVGPRWRTFGALLGARHAAAPDPGTFAAQAVRAATLTFELFTHPGAPTETP